MEQRSVPFPPLVGLVVGAQIVVQGQGIDALDLVQTLWIRCARQLVSKKFRSQ